METKIKTVIESKILKLKSSNADLVTKCAFLNFNSF